MYNYNPLHPVPLLQSRWNLKMPSCYHGPVTPLSIYCSPSSMSSTEMPALSNSLGDVTSPLQKWGTSTMWGKLAEKLGENNDGVRKVAICWSWTLRVEYPNSDIKIYQKVAVWSQREHVISSILYPAMQLYDAIDQCILGTGVILHDPVSTTARSPEGAQSGWFPCTLFSMFQVSKQWSGKYIWIISRDEICAYFFKIYIYIIIYI